MNTRLARLLLVLLPALALTSCVGPNKLKRGLDEHLNQRYHANPLLSQLLFPVSFLANHIAALEDLLVLNPTYWWSDVLRGEGTLYRYGEESAEHAEDAHTPSPGDPQGS